MGQSRGMQPKSANYWDYKINGVDAYREALSGADLEICQLEPGCLGGRHVRLDVPGGQFSYIETDAPMRGNGTFPNHWTLSVILGSATRSWQYGQEVSAGSLMIHRPGGEHDALYGRNFKVACISVQDEVFTRRFPQFHPCLQAAMRRPWSVFEPPARSRRRIIEHFAEGAAIIQSDPQVRSSTRAVAQFEEELLSDFLQVAERQIPTHASGAEQQAAAMVRQIDHYLHQSSLVNSSVAELCAVCEVPRRTLNRAFQNAVGMGPATYLRRVRLNGVRRALQQRQADLATVTEIALEFGFWHLGRFAEQYAELFGEAPHVTKTRGD